MSEELFILSLGAAGFVDALDEQKVDYQLAVLPFGSEGRVLGEPRMVARGDPGARTLFRKNVARVAASAAGDGQGLRALSSALSPSMLFGPNQGLIRPEAVLAVLVVSDKDDQSLGTVESFARGLIELKGGLQRASFSAEVSRGGWCPSGTGQPGTRYLELVGRTGGISFDLCSLAYGEDLRAFARFIGEMR